MVLVVIESVSQSNLPTQFKCFGDSLDSGILRANDISDRLGTFNTDQELESRLRNFELQNGSRTTKYSGNQNSEVAEIDF